MPIAFLVDGHTEQRFLQHVCRGNPVQRLNLNGSTVSSSAIAKRAATQIRLWRGRYYPIVILVDLEDRPCDHLDFKEEIKNALIGEEVVDQVIIGVANRMIENWILADCGRKSTQKVDGVHGANELKRFIPGYDKAIDGPNMLKAARASEIVRWSPSFADFYSDLSGVGCHWLTR